METVRINITIPVPLLRQLDQLTADRKRSRFISQAIESRIRDMNEGKLVKELKEGYLATRKEALESAEEFSSIDLAGWDDY
ncbi:MAG: hypothetical protein U9Q39_04630 [Pseudomonadota bacterium]|nr:hypothetical protein [Pseudomonadota bacterium]